MAGLIASSPLVGDWYAKVSTPPEAKAGIKTVASVIH